MKKQKKNLSEQTDAEIKHMKELVDRNVKTVTINMLHMSRKVDEIGLDKERHGICFLILKNQNQMFNVKKMQQNTHFLGIFSKLENIWGHKTCLDEHKSF